MAGNAEVCINCRKIFLYPGFGAKFCPACKAIDEENQKKVKDYLHEHGTANMYEISINTGVPEKIIMQYLKEGMLEVPEGSPIFLRCEQCNIEIRSGRWCPSCAAKMSSALRGTFVGVGEVAKKPNGSGKMRFIGRK